MGRDDLARNELPETEPGRPLGLSQPRIRLEDDRQVLGRDADAVIAHLDDGEAARPPDHDVDGTRPRRVLLYSGYLGAIWAFATITYNLRGGDVYRFALLFLGGLHILYDGFIWKLRRPAVAASLGLDPVAA